MHRVVLLLYFDVAVRYLEVMREDPKLVALVLGSLSNSGRLPHSRSRVQRCCYYLLLRLIKVVGAKVM